MKIAEIRLIVCPEMPEIALGTCCDYPDLHPDDKPLIPLLADSGVNAVPAIWDSPSVDWTRFDAVVLRSTWDYSARLPQFLRWLHSLSIPVWNSVETIEWNTDKRYLHLLRDAGIPIVPTRFIAPGEALEDIPETAECVVKPSVSAGSQDTIRLPTNARIAIEAHIARIHSAGKTAMVQPFLSRIADEGETALLFFEGEFSHAARKASILNRVGVLGTDSLYAAESMTPRAPSDAERSLAEKILSVLPFDTPLYARVDLLPGDDDAPVLLELELSEPSLFFDTASGSRERFARAVQARVC